MSRTTQATQTTIDRSRTQYRQLRSPIEDAFVSAVFGASSALEALCDNVLYKLTLTLNYLAPVEGPYIDCLCQSFMPAIVLTFKTQQTSSPQYLSQHISLCTSARNIQLSSVPLLCVSFRRTSFARRSFSSAAPLTWNSLPPAVLNCDSLFTFKSRLKTHLFFTAFC